MLLLCAVAADQRFIFPTAYTAQFLASRDTKETLVWKAYAVVALAFAGRGCEVFGLPFSAVRMVTSGQAHFYDITYARSKDSNVTDTQPVRGSVEVAVLDRFLQCYPTPPSDGRLFHKLKEDGGQPGGFLATHEKVGHNPAAQFGKRIAAFLELPDPQNYTGHCWRTTTLTWGADEGLSLAQLKSISDHKSDSVCQSYIQKSSCMKATTSAALAVGTVVDADASLSVEPPAKRARIRDGVPQTIIQVNLTSATINAPITFGTMVQPPAAQQQLLQEEDK